MTDFTTADQVLDAAASTEQITTQDPAPLPVQVALTMLDQALAGIELQVHAARQAVVLIGLSLQGAPVVDPAAPASATGRVPNVPMGQPAVNTFDD